MTTSWVVVASRTGARIFEHHGPGKTLRLIESLSHPDGRRQDRSIGTDAPGRSYESGSVQTHPLRGRESPHDHCAQVFARTLGSRLATARHASSFGRLVLVAEPHFLGFLRGHLDAPTERLVTHRISKDLASVRADEVLAHLGGALP